MSSDTWQGNHVTSQRKAAKHEVVSCGYKPPELRSTRIHSLDPPQLLRQLHHSLHTAVRLHPFWPTALGRAAFWGLKPPSPQKLHCLPSGKIRHTIYSSCRRCAAEQPSLCYLWAKVQLTTSRRGHGGVLGQVKSVLPPPLLLHAAEVRQLPRSQASMKPATRKVGEGCRAGERNHSLHALMLWP